MRLSFLAVLALWGMFVAQAGRVDSRSPVETAGGYPRFQLRGQPFFAHSAAFFYNRIPREEWGPSLVKLKEMGINTVDLYLAWNWHEPEEGKLDFDGHGNPRRDVKGLLAMLDEMGFAVIARPGPVILNEWRNGGYPDWLLARPEYQMPAAARLDGHYPPLSGLGASNSEEASRQWLANETHLKYTRKWFADVMREVLASRQATAGGNLIAIQLDDDQAINRTNYNGPVFWRYMNTLAAYLREAGATVPLYINPTDMRVSAAGAPHAIGAMGQWYFNFGADPALRWEDAATLQFYAETLKTQPAFPPMFIEYQAGWYGTGDDTYAKTADPTNTLLSSRVLLGHGLRGLNYFPVQDTLYPAGYEVPWANHHYVWESALGLDRTERPRAEAVHRNGRLLAGMGAELASAHKAADLGLVYPISAYEQAALTRDEILRVSRAQMQIQQYCQLNQATVEYLDLEFQPLEQLRRHKVLILPVPDARTAAAGREEITAANEPARREAEASRAGTGKLALSEAARRKLVEYVNAGGRLIVTPAMPEGDWIRGIAARVTVMPDWWRGVPVEPAAEKRASLLASLGANAEGFSSLLREVGVVRRLRAASAENAIEPDLVATMLVEDAPRDPARTFGFVSVANFRSQQPMRVKLNVADPAAAESRIDLPEVRLRPRDALLLPLRISLGAGREELVYATAELLRRELANGRIRMRFYAPDPAEVVLRLPHAPRGAVTINGQPAKFEFQEAQGLLRVPLLPIKGRKEDASDRRLGEQDLEIVYETGVPEIAVRTTRLLIGETNTINVEVRNRTAQPLRGRLSLAVARLVRVERFEQELAVEPGQTRVVPFALPVSGNAVPEDRIRLQASFAPAAAGDALASPAVFAEILPRFSWRVFPTNAAWSLRPDSPRRIHPPLLYPADDAATTATFNLRFANNTARESTITRASALVTSLPIKLAPDEEYLSTYTYNFPPGTKSALHPFTVTIGDGTRTDTVRVNFVALRKGEAVAFAYDVDGDGFEDYVLENEHLRLIVSPNAGARAFALIDKQSGANVFTSVGGLRDKFVELDPADPTRNPRRKRGVYGAFNRPYAAEILDGMGRRARLKLVYDAPDAYPAGARIEREITLGGGDRAFTVDYRVTPNPGTADGKQALWVASSLVIGDPAVPARRFATPAGPVDFAAAKTKSLDAQSGWLTAQLDDRTLFALLWRPQEIQAAEIDMKEFSSLLNLKFTPFASASPQTYRLVFALGAMTPAQALAEREKLK